MSLLLLLYKQFNNSSAVVNDDDQGFNLKCQMWQTILITKSAICYSFKSHILNEVIDADIYPNEIIRPCIITLLFSCALSGDDEKRRDILSYCYRNISVRFPRLTRDQSLIPVAGTYRETFLRFIRVFCCHPLNSLSFIFWSKVITQISYCLLLSFFSLFRFFSVCFFFILSVFASVLQSACYYGNQH